MRYSDLKHLTPKIDDTWSQVVASRHVTLMTGGNINACNNLLLVKTLLLSMMQHDYLTNDNPL